MKRRYLCSGPGAWKGRSSAVLARLLALFVITLCPSLLQATHVRVRDGQEVRLALKNILTTENVEKEDIIQFEAAEDVVVNGHTVIAKGAPATGKVVKVKHLGKNRAKDAFVAFRFITITAVDKQQVPLRKNASEEKKKSEKENTFEEDNPVPGNVERVIGADKGKVYVAYLDEGLSINAPDVPSAAQTTPAATTAGAPTSQTAQTPGTVPAAAILAQEPAIVDFVSDPSGADIMIDGNLAGNTPTAVQVPPGRHTIELRLSGYKTYTRSMKVDEGSHPRISTSLEKQ